MPVTDGADPISAPRNDICNPWHGFEPMASLCRPQAMKLKLAGMPGHASGCVDSPEVCQALYACDMTDWLEVCSWLCKMSKTLDMLAYEV